MKTSIKGCTALITGGGSGIGLELAKRLRELGCSVVICGRNQRRLSSAVGSLLDVPGKGGVQSVSLDVIDETAVSSMMEELQKTSGLDILVNCAGVAVNKRIEEMELSEFNQMLQTNVLGSFVMCKHALPLLKKSQSAFVINLCSAASHSFRVGQGGYSASKSALLSFTKTFALEVWPENIRVHAISPGAVLTDMIRVARPDLTNESMIQPGDLADAMEYLLTHRTNAVIDELVVHRTSGQPWPYNV